MAPPSEAAADIHAPSMAQEPLSVKPVLPGLNKCQVGCRLIGESKYCICAEWQSHWLMAPYKWSNRWHARSRNHWNPWSYCWKLPKCQVQWYYRKSKSLWWNHWPRRSPQTPGIEPATGNLLIRDSYHSGRAGTGSVQKILLLIPSWPLISCTTWHS